MPASGRVVQSTSAGHVCTSRGPPQAGSNRTRHGPSSVPADVGEAPSGADAPPGPNTTNADPDGGSARHTRTVFPSPAAARRVRRPVTASHRATAPASVCRKTAVNATASPPWFETK